MTEFVHLIGAGDVRAAGVKMQAAAGEMNRAAALLDDSLRVHRLFLDDWLLRLQNLTEEVKLCLTGPNEKE